MEAAVELQRLEVGFGASETKVVVTESGLRLDLAASVLAGPRIDRLEAGEEALASQVGHLHLLSAPSRLLGTAIHPCCQGLERAAHELYSEILGQLDGLALQRVWSFVPGINEEVQGLENYRAFNLGRFAAFREHHGASAMESLLPAASAVGLPSGPLAMVFIAGTDPVSFIENPAQVPAYHYPSVHGPVSPSFSRAAVIRSRDGGVTGYLSGTSSILGHETIGEGDLDRQFEVTWENVSLVRHRMGLKPGQCETESYRVYIRHRADFPRVRELFTAQVGPEIARASTFLLADICRGALRLEIEAVFSA